MGTLRGGCSGSASSPAILQWNDTTRATALSNKQSGDVMTFDKLLVASDCTGSGINLDANSTSITASAGEPIRSTGGIISMPIVYSNRQATGYLL